MEIQNIEIVELLERSVSLVENASGVLKEASGFITVLMGIIEEAGVLEGYEKFTLSNDVYMTVADIKGNIKWIIDGMEEDRVRFAAAGISGYREDDQQSDMVQDGTLIAEVPGVTTYVSGIAPSPESQAEVMG